MFTRENKLRTLIVILNYPDIIQLELHTWVIVAISDKEIPVKQHTS